LDWQLKTIVVGVDGSDQSIEAARMAVSLARKFGSRVLITTVVRPPEGWWGIGGAPPSPDAFAAAVVEGRRRILDRAEADLDLEGLEYETVEEVGDPATQLAEVCRVEEADLLVVGRRGAGLVERLVVGSVADRVAHTAPCAVLTVP
jgi:nucleotide-binding universal stress UspA family protein